MNYDDYKLEAEPVEELAECIFCGQPCDEEEIYCSAKCYNADLEN
jgi:predicted nucleic acid-binding Zn ribbon protein